MAGQLGRTPRPPIILWNQNPADRSRDASRGWHSSCTFAERAPRGVFLIWGGLAV